MRRVILLGFGLALLFVRAEAEAEDVPARAGHYYLRGIHEVGSELLLKPDQTYEWFLSYGAMDQQSKGRWREDGGKVILTAEKPNASAAFFELKGVEPWSEGATAVIERARADAITEKAGAFCPFVTRQFAHAYVNGQPPQQEAVAEATATAAPPLVPETSVNRRKRAKQAVAALPQKLKQLQQKRREATAAIDAFQSQTLGSAAWASASNHLLDVMQTYQDADEAARNTIVQTLDITEKYRSLLDGDDFRPLGQYALGQCEEHVRAEVPQADAPQVAVLVDDPEQQISLTKNGRAVLHLSSGSDMALDQFDNGFAFATLPEGASVKGLSMDLAPDDPAQRRHADFDVQAAAKSQIHLIMHVSQMMPQTFDVLELPIEGNALKFDRGQYEKE